jgi:hypothetical protein
VMGKAGVDGHQQGPDPGSSWRKEGMAGGCRVRVGRVLSVTLMNPEH